MKVDTTVITDAAMGASRSVAEADDSTPTIPAVILTVIPALKKSQIGLSGLPLSPEVSLSGAHVGFQPGGAGAAVQTMATLPRGSYTIDIGLAARFIGTPAPGAGFPDIRIDLANVALTTVTNIVGLFGVDLTASYANRRIDIVTQETMILRRVAEATAVGVSVEFCAFVNIERHL